MKVSISDPSDRNVDLILPSGSPTGARQRVQGVPTDSTCGSPSPVDRPRVWIALAVLATFAVATAFVLPAMVELFTLRLGFAASAAGRIGSLYSLAGIVGGLLGLAWIRRANRRLMLVLALLVATSADLSAIWFHAYPAVVAGRFLTGLCGASVMVVVNPTIAMSRHSERLFGISVAGPSVLSAVLLYLVPRAGLGVDGLFVVLGTLWIVCLPFVLLVPRGVFVVPVSSPLLRTKALASGIRKSSLVLLAFFAFNVATGALWTFASLIGAWMGASRDAVGLALSVSMLLSVAGGLLVTALGDRFGRTRPIAIGLGLVGASTCALLLSSGPLGFALAMGSVNLLTTALTALFLSLVGDEDRGVGQLLAIGGLAINLGYALGPLLLSPSGTRTSYSVTIVGSVVLFALALALVLVPRVHSGLPSPSGRTADASGRKALAARSPH